MKWLVKEYLYFSKAEIRIAILLASWLIITILINIFGLNLMPPSTDILSDDDKTVLDSIISHFELTQNQALSKQVEKNAEKQKENEKILLFPVEFDPNTVKEDCLEKIGLPSNVINNIISYRDAGGRFYAAKDLKRIYGMENDIFKQIEDYILIEQIEVRDTQFQLSDSGNDYSNFDTIELNSAAESDLTSLIGIGDVLAGRITKYRNLLGGFVNLEQLQEVYGLEDSIIQINMNKFTIDTGEIRKLSLNNSNFKEFLKHPYLEMNDVKSIFELRNFYNGKLNVNILNETKVLNDSTFRKIFYYLKN